MTATDFASVTGTWWLRASPEQLAMQYVRFRMAADLKGMRTLIESLLEWIS